MALSHRLCIADEFFSPFIESSSYTTGDFRPGRLALEGYIRGLGNVGCALHPVGYGCPVLLRYGLYEVTQTPVLADGDGEADTVAAADGDDVSGVSGVEVAVGAHGERPGGSCVTYPSHRLTQEVCCAPGSVGSTLAQPRYQHIFGSGGDCQQRMIASLA